MRSSEYDSFSYNGKVIELSSALNEDQSDLLQKYDKDCLYCPECKQAQLKFTRKTNLRKAFLSTKQASSDSLNNHANFCSHTFLKATKKQVKQYYDQLTDEQIEDKLKAAINTYLRSQDKRNEHPVNDQHNNPGVLNLVKDGQQIQRRLPRRSIFSIYDITDEELEIPVLYYGKVQLQTEEYPSKFVGGRPYHFLRVIDPRTRKELHRFYRGTFFDTVIPNRLYYLTVIAIVTKNSFSEPKAILYRSNSLLFTEVD